MSDFCTVTGKVKYTSRKEAIKQLTSVALRRGSRQCFKVYECRACKRYHLGRQTKGGIDRERQYVESWK